MKNGKFLEMLVECLQKLLVLDGISVTRNEKFYDEGTQIGEVDVVLRGKFGHTDMVVGIECRDRKGPQGRNWIREIKGKRDDLARFGFKHWIAVSSGGFTSTAKLFAKEVNIELLVPGSVKPLESIDRGPHTLMQFAILQSNWYCNEVTAKVEHDSSVALDQIETHIRISSWSAVQVMVEGERIPLNDLVRPKAEACHHRYELDFKGANFRKRGILKFNTCIGFICGLEFKLHGLEVEIISYREEIQSSFQITAFAIPETNRILGMIGINEYQLDGAKTYLMVGMKPDNVNNFVMLYRDHEGNPIKAEIVLLTPSYPPSIPLEKIVYEVNP